MPYVNVKITREGTTTGQKATLIREMTRLMVEVLGKNAATTIVVIEEVETDAWGIGGETVAVRRARSRDRTAQDGHEPGEGDRGARGEGESGGGA